MIDLTPALKLFAARRRGALARQDASAAQERELLSLVRRAADTRFGRDHDFGRIRSVAEFQARVPLRRYDAMWADYWKRAFPRLDGVSWPGPTPYFAVSSGTTAGSSKYIPVTPAMNRANTRAGLDVLLHHVAHKPASRVFGGKSFMLGGSTDLVEQAPGVFSGDLSGIAVKRLPFWAAPFAFPPLETALIADWEKKVDVLARTAPAADIRVITGTPSWLLLLFDKQRALFGAQKGARDIYPRLELLVHGGVNFTPYRARFESFLGPDVALREVYPASEGFIAAQDESPADGLRLMADNGLFFEFVPVEELDAARPTRHWLRTVETGVNYALVLSSCAGAWAYVIGDTVRFATIRPPRIFITGRTSYFMSAFGEHLIGEEIEDAVAAAAAAIGAEVTDYSMGALYSEAEGEPGGHLFIVEFASPVTEAQLRAAEAAIDATLSARNDDWKAHRADGFGMKAPRIHAVQPGTFAAWMKARGRLGGQNKVPRVINDTALFGQLRTFVGA